MPANNLPSQPTSFVGREKELSEIAALLANPACRLLTLVGAGGIGKTRLALQAAANQQPRFADGVAFVSLAALASSNLLPRAIAEALHISSFFSSDPVLAQLTRYLHDKQLLLIMDNFEHLLDGAGLLADLLQAAPNLKILVTSRERLNLQEEWLLTLDGLTYPTEPSVDSPENYGAVQLFVQRARQVQIHFSLDQNVQAVVSICRQVEGMPLGLELAASWLHSMSCKQIMAQMTSSLDFLTSPLRNIPERHRSLRMVFEQSWSLLSDAERSVLMRLSIFRGGFDLEAAVQVADATPILLAGLVDKSLIRLNNAGRYDLHELLRQFAGEKLMDTQTAENTAHRHLDYFVKLTEQGESKLFGREQIPWFDRLEVELNNLRAALTWSLRDAEAELGLRLVAALCWFFTERGHDFEGLEWSERLLPLNSNAPAPVRAKALHSGIAFAGLVGEAARVQAYGEQALALSRATNDRWNIAWSLSQQAFYQSKTHESSQWVEMLEESLKLFRELSDPLGLSHTLIRRAILAFQHRDYTYTRVLLDEVAPIAYKAGDKIIIGWINNLRGFVAWYQDDDVRQAKIFLENSQSAFREARFGGGVNLLFRHLAAIERVTGNYAQAQTLYKEALILQRKSVYTDDVILVGLASLATINGQFVRATTLLSSSVYTDDVISVGLASLATINGQFVRAATLLSSVDANEIHNFERIFPKAATFETDIATLRNQMGENAFAEAWALGKEMTREQIIAYALEDENVSLSQTHDTVAPIADQLLTDRELEILHLIADGLNSREVAQQLVLSVGTIRWYLKTIYSKLDAHSRSEAIAHAKSLKLLA